MREVSGQVSVLSDRDFHGTILWSFQLEGSPRWYRMGKKEPTFKEKEWIKFEEKNGNVEWGTVEAIAEGDQPASVKSSTSTESSSTTSTAVDVGRRLQYQAARRDASNLVIAALHTDHLPHAANVAKAKRLDLLLGYVEQVTKSLLKQEEDNG